MNRQVGPLRRELNASRASVHRGGQNKTLGLTLALVLRRLRTPSFSFTIFLVFLLVIPTVLFVGMLPFLTWRVWCQDHLLVWGVLYSFGVVNNLYQIFTHVFTALQYLGVPIPMIPGGADEKQTPAQFTFHNQLDLWGWWAYFIIAGKVPVLENILAAVHSSVGVVAWMYPQIFQTWYISRKFDTTILMWFKTGFVMLDAVVRTVAVWSLLIVGIETLTY
jgi:hypothetical protein